MRSHWSQNSVRRTLSSWFDFTVLLICKFPLEVCSFGTSRYKCLCKASSNLMWGQACGFIHHIWKTTKTHSYLTQFMSGLDSSESLIPLHHFVVHYLIPLTSLRRMTLIYPLNQQWRSGIFIINYNQCRQALSFCSLVYDILEKE